MIVSGEGTSCPHVDDTTKAEGATADAAETPNARLK